MKLLLLQLIAIECLVLQGKLYSPNLILRTRQTEHTVLTYPSTKSTPDRVSSITSSGSGWWKRTIVVLIQKSMQGSVLGLRLELEVEFFVSCS